MRRYYIFSGILLILPIIDFAIAAPVSVQEDRQAYVDVVHIPEEAMSMLGKRMEFNELWNKFLTDPDKKYFPKPEGSRPTPSALPAPAWMDVQPLPEEPPPLSNPDHAPLNPGSLTDSRHESMKEDALPKPSGQASSTMFSADHEIIGAHALSNPGLSTESDHEMVDVPSSSGSASPIESAHETVVPPTSPELPINPNYLSEDPDSPSPSKKLKSLRLT
jgi:hypothetical protein